MFEYVLQCLFVCFTCMFVCSQLLNALVERYFEPLRHETHLSQHEVL